MIKVITITLKNGYECIFETNSDVNINEALKQEIWSLSGDDGVIYIRTENISIVKVMNKE